MTGEPLSLRSASGNTGTPLCLTRTSAGGKPVGLKLLGEQLMFFRDRNGEVQALWDYCPHRGVYLSWGDCFWKGYVSCPYHGATFDGDGECVEFITEGPDSKMVGRLKAKKFPTRTLRGTVFVWMGEGEPAPIEEDVPPEYFDDSDDVIIMSTWRYWDCNWMIALENTSDAHNATYVHRNALRHMFGPHAKLAARPRTPLGYPSKIVEGRAVVGTGRQARENVAEYYYKDGKMPYQLHYPRTGGIWPLTRWRLLWAWFFEWIERFYSSRELLEGPEEWRGGMHLPGMQRVNHLYTRWCIPVEENLTRVLYARSRRIEIEERAPLRTPLFPADHRVAEPLQLLGPGLRRHAFVSMATPGVPVRDRFPRRGTAAVDHRACPRVEAARRGQRGNYS